MQFWFGYNGLNFDVEKEIDHCLILRQNPTSVVVSDRCEPWAWSGKVDGFERGP